MAQKRRITEGDSAREAREAEERQAREERMKEQSLHHWLASDYARRWYVLLCLAIDTFGGLQLASLGLAQLNIIVAITFEAAALAIEHTVYRRIWPKEED
ncbi:MAG: hypothetical protein ABR879_08025 [Methanomassiliicoccales archaeon]|jgi:hypothetical protein